MNEMEFEKGVDNKMRRENEDDSFSPSTFNGLIFVVVAESNPLKVTFSWLFATISLQPRSKTILKKHEPVITSSYPPLVFGHILFGDTEKNKS